MASTASLRPLLGLAVGLVLGGVGAVLFVQSMPPAEGSPEQQVARMEVELKAARNRIAALEAADPRGRHRPGSSFTDRARSIAERIRAGEAVTPEDLFRMTQPLLRDLAPLFDRIRVRDQNRRIDSLCGELARKYDLDEAQQETLRKWFERRAEEEAKRFSDLVAREGTSMQDVMRAARDVRPDDGLDEAMAGILSGDRLAAFKVGRLEERAARVQQEADMRLERLDGIVGLDETQRDQVFALMARNSRDYDPSMQFDGVDQNAVSSLPTGNPRDAVLSILRPDQRQAYETHQQERRAEAARELGEIGLALPPDWNFLDDDDFR